MEQRLDVRAGEHLDVRAVALVERLFRGDEDTSAAGETDSAAQSGGRSGAPGRAEARRSAAATGSTSR